MDTLDPDNTDEGSPGYARILAYTKFISCSLIGVLLFLIPVYYEGSGTIVLGIIAKFLQNQIGEMMAYFTIPVFVIGAILSAIYNLTPRSFAIRLPGAKQLIAPHWVWSALALGGGVFSSLTFLGVGPEWITSQQTGVTAYVDVAGIIFLLIGLGCLLLPFLTDYGLLEFTGTLLRRVFQALFNLPGRAIVDTLASWVGSSSIAVIMTGRQYERGYYSARESAVICTNFSVVSIPFVVFIAQIAGIEDYFFQLYSSMVFVCIVCALLTPRLPPLCWLSDEYFPAVGKRLKEEAQSGTSNFDWALREALRVAGKSDPPWVAVRKGFIAMLDIFFIMMPAAMTIEFLTLTLFHHTSFFQIVSLPFVFLLELLQIPEAAATAPGLIVGLFDQFVPAIIASEIESPIPSFVLAGLSVTQLIFFAETAILIKRSAIPLTTGNLIAIFFIRTMIALPILAVIAHVLF